MDTLRADSHERRRRAERVSPNGRDSAASPAPALGNQALGSARPEARLAFLLTANSASSIGNQNVQRVLGRIQRHPGSENLEKKHEATDHARREDQAAHNRQRAEQERADQARFDEMMSDALQAELESKTNVVGQVRPISLELLPPKLQAYLRTIQATITDVEQGLGKEGLTDQERQSFRARIQTAARSWHDDLNGKIPVPKNVNAPSTRATFFTQWRAEVAGGEGGDVTSKQRKNQEKRGVSSNTLPFREYTAVGWKQAQDKGRLIYDPIDDVFYLSLQHYNDTVYFQIIAPRATADSSRPASTYAGEFDLDFLIYQAWEELAADLRQMSAEADNPPNAPTDAEKARAEQFGQMTQGARQYVLELFRLRRVYVQELEKARAKVEKTKRNRQEKNDRLASMAKKNRTTAELEPVPDREPEQYAEFTWCTQVFVVGSIDGYIGYRDAKGLKLPAYKSGTTIGELAATFTTCVAQQKIAGPLEDVALALAALVAETTRHPAAQLEALFSVLMLFPSSTKAFGTALPMSKGGTIGTGGISLEVLLQEGQLGKQLIVKSLAEHLGKTPDAIEQDLIRQIAGTIDRKAIVARIKQWLFAQLVPAETATGLLPRKQQPKPKPTPTTADVQHGATTTTQAETEQLQPKPADPPPSDVVPASTQTVPTVVAENVASTPQAAQTPDGVASPQQPSSEPPRSPPPGSMAPPVRPRPTLKDRTPRGDDEYSKERQVPGALREYNLTAMRWLIWALVGYGLDEDEIHRELHDAGYPHDLIDHEIRGELHDDADAPNAIDEELGAPV